MTKPKQDQAASPNGSELSDQLGLLPEPRMWYDHATQKCSGMAPTGGTNERLWDSSDMHAYAAAAVAAERERCAVAAWTHYLDTCKKHNRAPSIWHEWCASDVIRSGPNAKLNGGP